MKEKIISLPDFFEKRGSRKATELREYQKRKFSLNTRQTREALELLSSLESNSVSLVLFSFDFYNSL